MHRKLKAAIIGHWGHCIYGTALTSNKDVKLLAVCDWQRETEHTEQIKALALEHDVPFFDSIKELCNFSNYDLISILAPPAIIPSIVEQTAANTRGLLLEKPVARNMEEVKKLVDAVKQYKVIVSVAYPNRFSPHLEICKQQIEDNKIGKPLAGSYTYLQTCGPLYICDTSPDKRKLIAGGDDTMFMGYGVLGLEWLADSRIKQVFARGGAFFYDSYRKSGINDLAVIECKMENGFVGDITVGRITAQGRPAVHKIDVSGESGAVSADFSRDKISVYGTNVFQQKCPDAAPELLVDDLVQALAKGRSARYNIDDVLQTVAVQDAVSSSMKSKQAVEVIRYD